MSFITQCSATRQSITEGARCRVVLLMMGRSFSPEICTFAGVDAPAQSVYGYSHTSDVDGLWAPVSGCLEAVAQDYGFSELVDSALNRRLLAHLSYDLSCRSAVVAADERNPAFVFREILAEHAPEFWSRIKDLKWLSGPLDMSMAEANAVWAALSRPLHRQRVFMADHSRVFRPLAVGRMHEAAYQWLLKNGEVDQFHGEDNRRDVFAERVAQEAVASYEAVHAERLAGMKELSEEQRIGLGAVMLENDLMDRFKYLSCQLYRERIWAPTIRAILDDYLRNGTALASRLSQELKGYLDDSYVFRSMWLLNIPFEPSRYAGDDFHNEDGKRFNAFCQEVNVAIAEERKTIYSE